MTPAKPVKAELIRKYLPKHPDMGGTALAKLINDENPSVTVTPQEISTMRSKMGLRRSNGSSIPPIREHQTPQEHKNNLPDVAAVIKDLKRVVDLIGKEQVRLILDLI